MERKFDSLLLFFFLLSFYLSFCSASKLASCFGSKHSWRHVMEEENEDEHVKTRSMCVYKHISILLHYSFFLLIYLFLSPTCIKTNSPEHTTTSLIPNGKRLSLSLSLCLSILSSILHRVPSANRSIITCKKKGEKRNKRKTGIEIDMFCIYLFLRCRRTKDRRSRERTRERERKRSGGREKRQPSIAADAASASSHHSVCLYLDEKQQ